MRPDADDCRTLGVAIANLCFDGTLIRRDDARLSSGWHAAEPEWRWTDGDAGLALAGVRMLSFTVALTGTYYANHGADAGLPRRSLRAGRPDRRQGPRTGRSG